MPKRSKTIYFPRFTLKKCIDRIDKLPVARCIRREFLLEMIGYTNPNSGPAGSAVGALAMFGLINQEDDFYEVTSFGRAISSPISEPQAIILSIFSFLLPEKFREVYLKIANMENITESLIQNLVLQQYTVTEKVSKKFARVFVKSGLFAKVFEKQDESLIVRNVQNLFKEIGIKLDKFENISDELITKTTDTSYSIDLLNFSFSPKIKSFSTNQEEPSHQIKERTSEIEKSSTILDEEHDFTQFELSDGVYVVNRSELESFIREKGMKLSEKKFKI
ncbi:MAG: hypothetical protein BAJATHORv1_20538 [Candidatus Thorarchaeota archaeon]|nr:MAG: hypothetical protein BAJATHORv1_20538 [Candidatus Thorarchaeota archaeon]